MKKILAIMMCCLLLTGCGNYNLVDFNYDFDKAIIKMPNGDVIEVNISTWSDSEGEQITIVSEDGTVYLVSANNCILIG